MKYALLLTSAVLLMACEPATQSYAPEGATQMEPEPETGVSVSGYARYGIEKG